MWKYKVQETRNKHHFKKTSRHQTLKQVLSNYPTRTKKIMQIKA